LWVSRFWFLGGSGRTKDRFIDPPRLALCFAVLCGAGSVATESWHPVGCVWNDVSAGMMSWSVVSSQKAFSFLINSFLVFYKSFFIII
jgi:hypothetical protein